jgi:hypothetical protein
MTTAWTIAIDWDRHITLTALKPARLSKKVQTAT